MASSLLRDHAGRADAAALLAGAAALEAVAGALLESAERGQHLARAVDSAEAARAALDHADRLRRMAERDGRMRRAG